MATPQYGSQYVSVSNNFPTSRSVPQLGLDNLTLAQQSVLQLLSSNPSRLLGLPIVYIADSMGQSLVARGIRGNTGNIIKIEGSPDQMENLYFTVHNRGDEMYSARIYEFEPRSPLKPLTKKELAKLEKDKTVNTYNELLEIFNRKVSTDYDKSQQSIIGGEKTLKDLENKSKDIASQIKKYTKQIVIAKKQLGQFKFKLMTLEDVILSLQEIYKNKKIEKIYLRTDKALVVQTHMLKTGEGQEIGRFAFLIYLSTTAGRENIYATNLDYSYSGNYAHPNINGHSICWGANGPEVSDMYKKNQLYQLIDFMVMFFSTWPHEDGSPYVEFDDWMEQKLTVNNTQDSYIMGTPLLEIPRTSLRAAFFKSLKASLTKKAVVKKVETTSKVQSPKERILEVLQQAQNQNQLQNQSQQEADLARLILEGGG